MCRTPWFVSHSLLPGLGMLFSASRGALTSLSQAKVVTPGLQESLALSVQVQVPGMHISLPGAQV